MCSFSTKSKNPLNIRYILFEFVTKLALGCDVLLSFVPSNATWNRMEWKLLVEERIAIAKLINTFFLEGLKTVLVFKIFLDFAFSYYLIVLHGIIRNHTIFIICW